MVENERVLFELRIGPILTGKLRKWRVFVLYWQKFLSLLFTRCWTKILCNYIFFVCLTYLLLLFPSASSHTVNSFKLAIMLLVLPLPFFSP